VPDLVVRALALFDPGIRSVVGDLGHKTTYSLENARRRVGWAPRPVEVTIVDCARSLLGQHAPTSAAGGL
jgi:dihydroflavonol-4-reductase